MRASRTPEGAFSRSFGFLDARTALSQRCFRMVELLPNRALLGRPLALRPARAGFFSELVELEEHAIALVTACERELARQRSRRRP